MTGEDLAMAAALFGGVWIGIPVLITAAIVSYRKRRER